MIIKNLPSIHLPKELVGHLSKFLSNFEADIFFGINHDDSYSIDAKSKFNLMNMSLEGKTISHISCHSDDDEYEEQTCDEIINWFAKITENA